MYTRACQSAKNNIGGKFQMVWILSARLHRRLVAKCKFAIGTCVLYLNESQLEFAPQKTEQVFFILCFSGEQREDAAYRAQGALFFFFGGGGERRGLSLQAVWKPG